MPDERKNNGRGLGEGPAWSGRSWRGDPFSAFALQLALQARRESQRWDEGCHIFAGYSYWTLGDFAVNPEHPPLVKLLASFPLLGLSLHAPADQNRGFKVETNLNGEEFVYKNDTDRILFRTRMAAAVLSPLLALLVFGMARETLGTGAAFLALALSAFDRHDACVPGRCALGSKSTRRGAARVSRRDHYGVNG